MKSLKSIILSVGSVMILSGCSEIEPSIIEYPVPTSRPFSTGNDGYSHFRIPSMVITGNNVVLAFCEGRVNGPEDEGDIDIVLRRSVDRGQTWSPLMKVKDDGENRSRNPCPVYLPEQNRVVLVTCWNPGATGINHVFVTYSDDEGMTWAPEKEITSAVTPADYRWYATGPCHGIVKQFEPNKGRIVVACNHNTTKQANGRSHVIYSDDNGDTWKLGGIVDLYDTNESTVAELSNGDLMLNMRPAGNNPKYRIKALSHDGGLTWDKCESTSLMDPMCQGSIFYYGKGADGKGLLLFTNADSQSSRFHNTLKLSEDDGMTWTRKYDYTQSDYGGYSDVAKYTDGSIAVLYEFGYKNSGIAFQNIDFSQLK